MGYRVGVVCDRGLPVSAGGRERNEDSYLICAKGRVQYLADEARVEEPADGDGVLVAVFDGMGGHADGHIASTTAARVVAKLYQPGAPAHPARVLVQYIRQAQESLHLRAKGTDGRVHMGTTLTAAWLLRGHLNWAHVGDSRIYHLRGQSLECLSDDQTRNLFRRRDGQIEQIDGNQLAQGFIYGSRGLGHDPQLRIEMGRDAGSRSLNAGDRLMLCSDGLTNVVSDERIQQLLSATEDPQVAAEDLVSEALCAGTRDNVTVLVVLVDAEPDVELLAWNDDGEETVQF